MLNEIKMTANMTTTENGAAAFESTLSDCLDLFADIGAVRGASDERIETLFARAFAENPDYAMKVLFYGRDVRGGLGERRVFRVCLKWLAENAPASLKKNIANIPEYGRFDDLLCLIGTPVEAEVISFIGETLKRDLESKAEVSLLAKWLPSVNASSKETVLLARHLAEKLGMSEKEYRKTVAGLRARIGILENNLREKDYTFEYSAQPSCAMLKYRKAFIRNDGERYSEYLDMVAEGKTTLHTAALTPYDIVKKCLDNGMSRKERKSLDVTWNSLPDFCGDENSIAVVDGSGSMYGGYYRNGVVRPIDVALSLGIYFAEHSKGEFRNHFITFSARPRLVEIKGRDILEKVEYCKTFNEVANTNLQAVFELILDTAVRNHLPAEELPKRIYIISDMEFDCCAENADVTNFQNAKRAFAEAGYELPEVVFWNVESRNSTKPVTKNEQGAALVSGFSPVLFSMVAGGNLTPYGVMLDVISRERYAPVCA